MKTSRLFPVFLLLLGLVLLWRGLDWFGDWLAGRGRAPSAADSPRPARTPRPTPTPAPTPTPRAISDCIQVGGGDEIGAAIAELGKYSHGWPSNVDHAECLVEALAARATEDPDRIRDALIPYAFSTPARLRRAAYVGLEQVPVQEIPPKLREMSWGNSSPSLAVYASLALGLDEETAPDLVYEFLDSPKPGAHQAMFKHVVSCPKRAAAVFIAEGLASDPANVHYVALAKAREWEKLDVSDALADVALDESRPVTERQAVLEPLGTMGDSSVVPRLAPLLEAADAEVRSYAEAATAALRTRRPRRRS
jgi:hypothetical protein